MLEANFGHLVETQPPSHPDLARHAPGKKKESPAPAERVTSCRILTASLECCCRMISSFSPRAHFFFFRHPIGTADGGARTTDPKRCDQTCRRRQLSTATAPRHPARRACSPRSSREKKRRALGRQERDGRERRRADSVWTAAVVGAVLCVQMCIDMCIDMCLDMCMDMCTDMCTDMSMCALAYVWTCV